MFKVFIVTQGLCLKLDRIVPDINMFLSGTLTKYYYILLRFSGILNEVFTCECRTRAA